MNERPPNGLAGQTSPYLLQHAHNPVAWFPWGEEAFQRAREEDKPIFLSIGYAACHWCHVMERESFEDEATAALLNDRFVSIKVDREERPDIDSIYMDAVQAMNGSGGWPLSAFITPEGRPFYAGTYFPPEPRQGLPSFSQVLTGLADAWRDRRDEIDAQSIRVTEAIDRAGRIDAVADPLTADLTADALARLREQFDPRWGGFGAAPKFPQPMTLEFLLRQALRGAPDALEMAVITLDRMADGGMHDQVGGGFSRYSTDAAWHVPHFEKMLYDNALLARLYVRAWQVTKNERYRTVASRTLDYLLREMRDSAGGFWSSQDADSDGVEGRFFVWSWDELAGLVGEAVATAFGATREGNWEGTNVLWQPLPIGGIAAEFGLRTEELAAEIEGARGVLREVRARRVHPGTDDKVVTAWNAMAIEAFAEAGRAFDAPSYVRAAERCGAFVLAQLRAADGRVRRSWREGIAGGTGFCDDHALLCSAFLALYGTTFEPRWFLAARELGDVLLERFQDEERGGFFLTGADAGADLVVRPKELYDNAVPSGNSVAAEVLIRLSLLTGASVYAEVAERALRLVMDGAVRAPSGFGHALCAIDLYLGPSKQVAVIGDPRDVRTRDLLRELSSTYRPNVVVAAAASGDREAEDTIELLRGRLAVDGGATAYVCERFACKLPVTSTGALAEQLAQ
ncbi:MAG: thioredoxin domain-containing protein [Actinomycetota bacterium]